MLSSKERLLKCINHEPVDRVPISTYELNGYNKDAWENKEPSYTRLMDMIRGYTDCMYMYNLKETTPNKQNAETISWREGPCVFSKSIMKTSRGDLEALYRKDDSIHTTWTLKHFLEDIDDIDTFLSFPFEPGVYDIKSFEKEKAELGDKGLMMISLADPVCVAAELFEMSTFLVYAMTEYDRIKYLLDAIHERQMHSLREILKNDMNDVIFRICGPEYATPPYLSPEYFHDIVTCYLIKMCSEIKSAGGIPRIHSHGKIGSVISQFAQTDAMALDPLEPPPDGDIDLKTIKALYGKKFCLMGNIELKELETANTERIDSLVKNVLADAMHGSGFVLMTTASPINVPLSSKTEKNYFQMIESAHKYGYYL